MIRNRFILGTTLGLLALTPASPLSHMLVSPASAGEQVSVSISLFYDRLAPHGDWVNYHGADVFVPTKVESGWRPYTRGHWAYTEPYGWLWVSLDPFGWATDHYGRWAYGDDIGWFWVPGEQWAPAWVSWRRSGQYVVWAPLPPRHGDRDLVSIDIDLGDVPDFYWVAVPTEHFWDRDVSRIVIRDHNELGRIVSGAERLGEVRVENGRAVDTALDVHFIEEATKRKAEVIQIRKTDKPEEARTEGNTVAVFDADLKKSPDDKPAKTTSLDAVKKTQALRTDKPTSTASGSANDSGAPQKLPATTDQSATSQSNSAKTGTSTATGKPLPQTNGQASAGQSATDQSNGTKSGNSTATGSGQASTDQSNVKQKKMDEQTSAGKKAPSTMDQSQVGVKKPADMNGQTAKGNIAGSDKSTMDQGGGKGQGSTQGSTMTGQAPKKPAEGSQQSADEQVKKKKIPETTQQ